jgi:hypothetical protein
VFQFGKFIVGIVANIGIHSNGNLLAKRGNCFNKTIVENYNEIPCVSGKRTTTKFNKTISL